MMPELDGFGVLAALREQGRVNDLPVIVISAMSEIDAVVRCVELGAEDFLFKPFNPTLLRARVLASLEKKALRDQTREELRRKQAELKKLAPCSSRRAAAVPAADLPLDRRRAGARGRSAATWSTISRSATSRDPSATSDKAPARRRLRADAFDLPRLPPAGCQRVAAPARRQIANNALSVSNSTKCPSRCCSARSTCAPVSCAMSAAGIPPFIATQPAVCCRAPADCRSGSPIASPTRGYDRAKWATRR
jgi:hypothetical protein